MISTAAWKTEQRNVLSFPPFQQARRRLTKKSSLLSIVVSHRWGSLQTADYLKNADPKWFGCPLICPLVIELSRVPFAP